jgi:hypothetical protein
MFKGYKTYIVGGLAIVGAVANYLVGDVSLAETVQLVVTAAIGMTIRNAIPKDPRFF